MLAVFKIFICISVKIDTDPRIRHKLDNFLDFKKNPKNQLKYDWTCYFSTYNVWNIEQKSLLEKILWFWLILIHIKIIVFTHTHFYSVVYHRIGG